MIFFTTETESTDGLKNENTSIPYFIVKTESKIFNDVHDVAVKMS